MSSESRKVEAADVSESSLSIMEIGDARAGRILHRRDRSSRDHQRKTHTNTHTQKHTHNHHPSNECVRQTCLRVNKAVGKYLAHSPLAAYLGPHQAVSPWLTPCPRCHAVVFGIYSSPGRPATFSCVTPHDAAALGIHSSPGSPATSQAAHPGGITNAPPAPSRQRPAGRSDLHSTRR